MNPLDGFVDIRKFVLFPEERRKIFLKLMIGYFIDQGTHNPRSPFGVQSSFRQFFRTTIDGHKGSKIFCFSSMILLHFRMYDIKRIAKLRDFSIDHIFQSTLPLTDQPLKTLAPDQFYPPRFINYNPNHPASTTFTYNPEIF